MSELDELFRNIRESVSPAVWSKGVELSRQDAVTGDRESADEVVLRVKTSATSVSPTVSLYVADGDWHCTCGGTDDPCAHVAASIIALRRAREQGQVLPRSKSAGGKVIYRFSRDGGALSFERFIRHEGGEERLATTLTAITSGRVQGPPVSPTATDLEAEVALGGTRAGKLPAAVFPALLRALKNLGAAEDLTLDGAPVAPDAEPVGLIAELRDDGPGVRLSARQDPAIRELFSNGVALCDSGLRPVILPDLSPKQKQLLKDEHFYGMRELGDLVGTVLPALEAKMPVKIHTAKLPGRDFSRPRIELQMRASGEYQLVVTPRIVYGDPVLAHVEDGQLHCQGAKAPRRDIDGELRLKDALSRTTGLELGKSEVYSREAAVAAAERLRRLGESPTATTPLTITGDGWEKFRQHPTLVPTAKLEGATFDVTFTVPGPEAKRASANAVFAAWQAGESLVSLMEGGYAPLPKAWLERFGDRVLELLAARTAAGDLGSAAAPALVDLANDLELTPSPALKGLSDKLQGFTKTAPHPLPADFAAKLRDYQKQGVDWLATLKSLGLGALLADDMGLGKTLQSIAVINSGKRTLVVAPTTVLFNWQAELKRFRPNVKVALYHGANRRLDLEAEVVITTYALLRLDEEKLVAESWDTVILDEAQAIKNPDSQAARSAYRLRANFRLALSGTPVENRLADLWSLMQFLNPGLLGDKRAFQERYARQVAAGDVASAERLRQRVRPFLLRRLKRDVIPELPPRTEQVLHVELSASEREQYEVVRAAARRDVTERLASGVSVMEVLEALLRLRQACCHPSLIPGVASDTSSKLAVLVETLEEAVSEGHKALVFSQWTSFLDLIEPAVKKAGIASLRLDGTTTDRASVVNAFQSPGGPPVLLMSLKAGGVGLNLTAADHVFITDPWWNPAAEDQAADRAHRIGQERPVLVQRLVALDSVEERILALQEKKRALAGSVMDGRQGSAEITREDLLSLLD